MQASRYKRGDTVRIKGTSQVFKVGSVYYLVDSSDRKAGFYYSGYPGKDIHEADLDMDAGNGSDHPDGCEIRFSENLRALIARHKVTFTQLSIGARVSRSSCYDAAYRGAPTKVSTLVSLSRFFNVSMDELMFGKIAEDQSAGSTDA